MNGERFGLAAALATPFAADGSIDAGRMVDHARWCLANGCGRIAVFGTTGEGPSIGDGERDRAWQALAAAGIGGSRVVGGVIAATVESAARQAVQAYDQDAHAVLVTPPYYFKDVDEEGVFRWFARLIETLGTRARDILLYNIPSLTGVPLSVTLVGRLAAAFPGIVVGVKDSSSDWSTTEPLLKAHAASLAILVGDERDLARAVRLGGQGAISGLANLCPGALLPLATTGQDDPRIDRLVDAICTLPVIPAIKTLLARQTGHPGWSDLRPPLLPTPATDTHAILPLLDDALAERVAGRAA